MIQLLATRYNKHIAYCFFLILWMGFIPANAWSAGNVPHYSYSPDWPSSRMLNKDVPKKNVLPFFNEPMDSVAAVATPPEVSEAKEAFIDGPGQPEMSSFQPAGTGNLVNLFTGDFNYNIPLMDVGGYPVNIFYNGGVSTEQEASWVGLGWNINPGNVNRNMRGVPDDFNGMDSIKQYQAMKPNKTWGFRLGPDFEFGGAKIFKLNVDLGASFNNYLGPAVEFGLKGSLNASIGLKIQGEKSAFDSLQLKFSAGAGANLNTRYGITASLNSSFTTNFFMKNHTLGAGVGLGTSYNSRSGIKDLQISEQMSLSRGLAKQKAGEDKPRQYSSSRNFHLSSSISFARPSYIPVMRAVNTNTAFSGHFQIGSGLWGAFTSAEVEVYFQKAEIRDGDTMRKNPMIGYMYYQKGFNDRNAVMDFSRVNDREVTPNTPIISAPQYAYDVFSIQGQGTGGTVRAYRNDISYVKDAFTGSRDKSISAGADVGIPGHYGANFNTISSPSTIGEWNSGNKLRSAIPFKENRQLQEAVYFGNPGESSVIAPDGYNKIGGADLVRFKLGGSGVNPTVEPILQRIDSANHVMGEVSLLNSFTGDRKKRTQVINFLTASEAIYGGLDSFIHSYNPDALISDGVLDFEKIGRTTEYRKGHHISQINVTESDGKRYIYGLPVYNLVQKDLSFTVQDADPEADHVPYELTDSRTNSQYLSESSPKDGYVQVTETPAFPHSFLLSGLLSPDYVDVTGNGITEDDLGTAIKFNYSRVKQGGEWAVHKWRTPHSGLGSANLNAGNRTEKKDDKGIVAYGERESWYLHSIESKTMIAVFRTGNRAFDGKGAIGEFGGVNSNDNSLKRLDRIDLYNKADLKKNGESGARPIKSVHFSYSYRLCPETPDNPLGKNLAADSSGKLTLEKIWFSYNGQTRANKDQYVFSYGTTAQDNPAYENGASDRWGTYKPKAANTASLKNRDYPYTKQNQTESSQYASAWSLKKILLPSGGQIEVDYEADDYAYVQNRRAAQMMNIVGLGTDTISYNNELYNPKKDHRGVCYIEEKYYLFVKVPEACSSKEEVKIKYLDGVSQLAMRLSVNMPKGMEYVPCYAMISEYGVSPNDPTIVWIKVKDLDGLSPLSVAAIEYLREQLPGQAYKGYDLSEGNLKDAAAVLIGMLGKIGSNLKTPILSLRCDSKARTIQTSRSFVRLNVPGGFKYGGGQRVKAVRMKDNWATMQGGATATYGQLYDYTTTEVFNGQSRAISSGVASYEPTLGGEENPFQTIVQVANKLPMGPTSYGAVEMPVLDAFFPSPVVGYSKVTVRAYQRDLPANKKSKSGVGKQVSEYFTAKDYPVQYAHTSFDESSDRQAHKSSRGGFLYKYAFDSRALSQGFIVSTNDMHGQVKSQSSYAENDTLTRISYTRNYYKNTGENKLDEKFDFAYNNLGGEIRKGNMGVDIELMTDVREFSVKTTSKEDQAQVDLFPIVFPFWLFFFWEVNGNTENTYRAVTTTKTVNYHAVLDSVVVIDKGSTVSTKNLVYDAETGSVIVNRTNNEFDKPVYTVNYPAYWAYGGMGLAYKNIDAVFNNISFVDGRVSPLSIPVSALESGDELLITNTGGNYSSCGPEMISGDSVRTIWAFDVKRNNGSLASAEHDFIFLDKKGQIYSKPNVSVRIVRSGKRNMLNAPLAGVTMMESPIALIENKTMLNVDHLSKVVNASAVEYREKWQTDNDAFRLMRRVFNPATCTYYEVEDCSGYLEKSINPYVKGMLGTFRANRSFTFYGSRDGGAVTANTELLKSGFLQNFALYWNYDADKNLMPPVDLAETKWVLTNQTTRYNSKGMELETKDALGIYASALYGFSKTMPVAIANNARYDEIASDGFEDNTYSDRLSAGSGNNCAKPFVNFRNMGIFSGSRVINADSAGFKAHTGKFVLSVDANTTVSQTWDVKAPPIDSFNIHEYTTKSKYDLWESGGNLESFEVFPTSNLNSPIFPIYENGVRVGFNVMDDHSTGSAVHDYNLTFYQYINIPAYGAYPVRMFASRGTSTTENLSVRVIIEDLDGGAVTQTQRAGENFFDQTVDLYLCPGKYKIKYVFSSHFSMEGQALYPHAHNFEVDLPTLTAYKSKSELLSCRQTIPFPAKDSMQNPLFRIPSEKRMLFSTWVKENCETPCTQTTYVSNQVTLQFTGGSSTPVTLKPTGMIIEGWQRYEGAFNVPIGATSMMASFVNNSSQPIYFDDVRIHPFNANMKTYVYDPVNLRLTAELDANNYASFYEYDAEGTLIRTKAETKEGIKTITETRSAKQKSITSFN
jgi:hypothetical protein